MELYRKTAGELQKLLDKGDVSSEDIVHSCLQRIERCDPDIHAFIAVTEDEAYAEARCSDKRRQQGKTLSPWDGIPIAISDNVVTRGIRTTCASAMLRDYTPVFDATAIAKLKQAGLPILGKTNLAEFAIGGSSNHDGLVTHNPVDTSRTAGDALGGAAAAVASHATPWSLATDTGGSLQQAAAYCGVVGLRPTYGRVSRYGLIPFASSIDQIGPLTQSVQDAKVLLGLIAGDDNKDSTLAAQGTLDPDGAMSADIKNLRIGLPQEYFDHADLDPSIKSAVEEAVSRLETLGAKVDAVSLPHTSSALSVLAACASAEASANLGRFDGVRYGTRIEAQTSGAMFTATRSDGFLPLTKEWILLGTALSTDSGYAALRTAMQVRTLLRKDFAEALAAVDVLVAPTTLHTATPLGHGYTNLHDSLAMYALTAAGSLAGLPGLVLHCGLDENALPIGLQLIGNRFQEDSVFRAAFAWETMVKEVIASG